MTYLSCGQSIFINTFEQHYLFIKGTEQFNLHPKYVWLQGAQYNNFRSSDKHTEWQTHTSLNKIYY